MAIHAGFTGFLASDAESRTAKSGKPWTRLRVGVGTGDVTTWVSVAIFGSAAIDAANLKKGEVIHASGTISINSWTGNDGNQRHELALAARWFEKALYKENRDNAKGNSVAVGQTYHSPRSAPANRLPRSGEFDDSIPFAPEVR